MSLTEVNYFCKFDKTFQPALIRISESSSPRPLVVALHTWSFDHTNCSEAYRTAPPPPPPPPPPAKQPAPGGSWG